MIRAELIAFIKELAIEMYKLENELVSKLEETIKKCIATDVLSARMTFHHFFKAKHKGCVVRAQACALKERGITVADGLEL